jgi:hypothetical protein
MNNQSLVVFAVDEAAIEQMIDARRQKQSVVAVKSFLIGRVAARLTMARGQMNGIFDIRDPVWDPILRPRSLNSPYPFRAR